LRGKKYNERQAKQSIVKKDLGYWDETIHGRTSKTNPTSNSM
jgi:hypothetical protein